MIDQASHGKMYYPFLDGFRAIAILAVVFYHIIYFFNITPFLNKFFLAPVIRLGMIGIFGVDMFFVISGFLITGLLIGDLDRGQIRIKRFYYRRFYKIIPQYLLIVLVGLTVTATVKPYIIYGMSHYNSHDSMSVPASYFVFLQNYVPQVPILAHTWSIAIEEHFYFIYPLLLSLTCLLIKDRKTRHFILIILFLVLILIGNIYRYRLIAPRIPISWQTTQFRFDALVFGCLIKLLEPYLSNIKGNSKEIISFCLFGAGASIYYMFLVGIIDTTDWQAIGCAYLAPGLLIVSCLMDCLPLKFIAERNVLRWIGKNSYGIYLWHYILIFFFAKDPSRLGTIPTIILYVIFTILVGFLSTITIERYFLNLRKKLVP